MNKDALNRLREQVRLRQLRQAVKLANAGDADDLAAEANLITKTITEKIDSISEAMEAKSFGAEVPYNKEQQAFIDSLLSGKPVALTGPAGSGKTTAVKGGIRKLLEAGKIPPVSNSTHDHIHNGSPGVACVAFTNKAVENMKRVLPKELRPNCITIHKLLEFKPEYFDTLDEKGNTKKTMRFVPTRHAGNPLPSAIKVIFIDEATMVAVDLWNLLADAIQHPVQIVLIGDIQQLPPVFGKPIFIYAMQAGVETIELVEVHRQALESPIISLAHKILEGKQIPGVKLPELNYNGEHGVLTIKPWKKKLSETGALKMMGMFLPEMIDAGNYDPLNDVILCPFHKPGTFGCTELNKIVANHLVNIERRKLNEMQDANEDEIEKQRDSCLVHEVIAGIQKRYFRVGEKVLYNKTEWFITGIKRNPKYLGKPARTATITLDYSGMESDPLKAMMDDQGHLLDKTVEDVDALLASMNFDDNEEKDAGSRAASHVITVYSEQLDIEETLETAGAVNTLDLGYAITVHKSQGSEYRRVLFLLHESNNVMLFRELVYTAVTRAKEELLIVCPPNALVQGINTQRLPGKTLTDKIAAFDRACKLQKGAEQPERLDLFKTSGLEAA